MGPILPASEGFVLGVGAKMFTIAGSVIVYSVSASVIEISIVNTICKRRTGRQSVLRC